MVTGDTDDTVAVALAGGYITRPGALALLTAHPAWAGQVITFVCLKGHRLPAGACPPARTGAFACSN